MTYENPEIGVSVEWGYGADWKESDIDAIVGITFDFTNKDLENQFISKLKKMGYRYHGGEYPNYSVASHGMCFEVENNGKYILHHTW